MTLIQKLRLWINDKNASSQIFTDDELTEILSWYDEGEETNLNKQIDLARADCLEMIATDIRRWNSYTIDGLSETMSSSKSELRQVAKELRAKWDVATGSDL